MYIQQTEYYTGEAGKTLVGVIYEEKYTGVLKGTVNFRHIRERGWDDLYSTFKSWRQSVKFDVDNFRDQRLRSYYGDIHDRCIGSQKSQFMHSCTYTFPDDVLFWNSHTTLAKAAKVFHIGTITRE